MSVTASVAAVQVRIQQIQTQFVGRADSSRVLEMSGRGGTRSASAASFDAQLATATGTAGDVLDVAQRYLGVPYVWGGEDPSGFDCSGLVQYAFRHVGIEMPRVSEDQARAGTPVASLADARPGDLVAFHSPVDHIGIYAGGGRMIVAPKTGDVVKIQDISETPTAIRRVLPDETRTATPVDPSSVLTDRVGFLAALFGGAGVNTPVTVATPGPGAAEGKLGKRVSEAATNGDFAAILAAVSVAASAVPADPPTPAPGVPDGTAEEPEGAEAHGADVITPHAAGLAPGPFPADVRPGATVTLPDTAAHTAPVRGEHNPSGAKPAPAAPLTPDLLTGVAETDTPPPAAAAGWGEGPVPGLEEQAPSPEAAARVREGGTAPAQRVPEWAQAVSARTAEPGARRPGHPGVAPAKPEGSRPGAEAVRPAAVAPVVPHAPQAAAPVAGPAPVTPAVPVAAPAVVSQVVEVIKPLVRMEDGSDEVVLELRPADLGIVRVEVRVEHGVVHATLHADQDATADLLRQSLPDLRSALADAGLQSGDLGCENGRNAGGGPSQNRPAWGRDPDRDPGTPAEPALIRRAADPRRSLDVLL